MLTKEKYIKICNSPLILTKDDDHAVIGSKIFKEMSNLQSIENKMSLLHTFPSNAHFTSYFEAQQSRVALIGSLQPK